MTSVHGQYVRPHKSSMPNVWVCLKTMRSQMCERFIKKRLITDNPLDFGVHHFCTNQFARPSWSPNLCWMCYLFALHVSCCGRSPWTKFYSSHQHPLLHANRQAKRHISNPAHPWHNNTDTCHITFTSQRIQKKCFRFVFKKIHPWFETFFWHHSIHSRKLIECWVRRKKHKKIIHTCCCIGPITRKFDV